MAIWNQNGRCGCQPAAKSKSCCCSGLQAQIEQLQGYVKLFQAQIAALKCRDECAFENITDLSTRITDVDVTTTVIEDCLLENDLCGGEDVLDLCPCSEYVTCGTL